MTTLGQEMAEELADYHRQLAALLREMLALAAGQSPPAPAPTPSAAPSRDTKCAQIRPRDPLLGGDTGLRIGRYRSDEAVRVLLHCFFRDSHNVIDLTYGAGRFWRPPHPPGIALTRNNLDPNAEVDLHVDFRSTGLADDAFDVSILDPPHLPHLGDRAFMRARYGTVRSTAGFRALIEDGVREAWRISRVGIICKLADAPNGGAYLALTSWAVEALGVEPVYVMHTIGRPSPRPKGEVARVPRNNGSDWLVFRKGGHRYPDFIRLFERQQASRLAEQKAARRCAICDAPIGDRRRDAATCSDLCRKQRQRKKAGPR
jgi:hypothetical protein